MLFFFMDCGRKWFPEFNAGKSQILLFDWSSNTGLIDVKMDVSVTEEKMFLKMIGFSFSSKLDSGSYIISIAKAAFKKIGAMTRSVKFLSLEVALHPYKLITRPCIEYVVMSGLVLLTATWKC